MRKNSIMFVANSPKPSSLSGFKKSKNYENDSIASVSVSSDSNNIQSVNNLPTKKS